MDLFNRLLNVYAVCDDCGAEYGVVPASRKTYWKGYCGVCNQHAMVTEAREYGYLKKGLWEILRQQGKSN